jgi:hypothetical protein
MVTVSELVIRGWFAVPGAIAWIFVIIGTTHCLFRSFLKAELDALRSRRDDPNMARLRILDAELRSGREYQARPKNGNTDPLMEPRKLDPEEIADRRELYGLLQSKTIWKRFFNWACDCHFCHTFWVAVGWYWFTNGLSVDLPATCLMFAAIASLSASRVRRASLRPPGQVGGGCPSGNCGG